VQDSPQVERENIGDDFSRGLLPVVKHPAISNGNHEIFIVKVMHI
jgi:hypothetical protein